MAGDMSAWINEELSSLLDFPVPEDMTKYIISIENARDLEEYIKSLLNLSDKKHHQFFMELLQRRQAGYSKKAPEENLFVLGKSNEKKNSKNRAQATEVEEVFSPKEATKDTKKKTHYVNLYSPEGLTRDVVTLKGRHRCDCQATKHRLVNNCLSCGRIVCEQEGSGPCLYCDTLVCSPEEQEMLSKGTKNSNKLYQKLLEQSRPQGWEAAIEQRNRLLEYDKTSQIRTKVIDDESDYYASNSVWLSKEERDKLKLREDEVRSRRHTSRLDRKITFDFAGRKLVEAADDMNELYPEDDDVLREISQSLNRNSEAGLNESSIHPGLMCAQPIYQPPARLNEPAKKPSAKKHVENNTVSRVQDRQFLEMCDDGYCLSMHQPWASLLVAGIKMHEGRSWYSAHRGRLWIAATAKAPDQKQITEIQNFYKNILGEHVEFPTLYPVGCLLGCVNVSDVLAQEEYNVKYPTGESDSPFVFICDDPQELPIHFPLKGQHKIYKLDKKMRQAAQKSLQRIAKLKAEHTLSH